MTNRNLRLATRASRLALVQAQLAIDALRRLDPALYVDIVEVTTQGDRDRQTPLSALGGQGIFAAAVREAVLVHDRADFAVHSLKDVPTTPVDGLVIAAMLERADPRDCLVSRDGATLAALPAGARVGTSSTRRAALLRALRPDLEPVSIRGNVETRIQKVRDGEYDAAILAVAGLARLDRLDDATELLDSTEFPPSPGQGVIGIECRADDEGTRALLARLDHAPTRAAAEAERGVLATLGVGCEQPVGAYARVDGDRLTLHAVLGDDNGRLASDEATAPVTDAAATGHSLGRRLLEATRAEAGR